MWVTTANSSTTATLFWRKRAIRIYPIYWVALSIWIICRLIAPDRLANVDVTAKTTILSYFLIPHYHLAFTKHVWPILIPGWTLQYELFFYLIFGLALSIVSRPLRAACILACLSFLTVVGCIVEPANALLTTYTDPLLLEFGGGVILGIIYLRGRRLPPWLALATILIAILGLMIDEYLFSEKPAFSVSRNTSGFGCIRGRLTRTGARQTAQRSNGLARRRLVRTLSLSSNPNGHRRHGLGATIGQLTSRKLRLRCDRSVNTELNLRPRLCRTAFDSLALRGQRESARTDICLISRQIDSQNADHRWRCAATRQASRPPSQLTLYGKVKHSGQHKIAMWMEAIDARPIARRFRRNLEFPIADWEKRTYFRHRVGRSFRALHKPGYLR
jgi:hypothetical protein